MKFKTVREGEQAVVYNYLGEGNLVIGPERVRVFVVLSKYVNASHFLPSHFMHFSLKIMLDAPFFQLPDFTFRYSYFGRNYNISPCIKPVSMNTWWLR